ncbi:MAG: hypothetical protein IPJ85_06145 [Flavobacteriales bacterium]|nr:hypothetical protein [Flavobacteriales bacterium]
MPSTKQSPASCSASGEHRDAVRPQATDHLHDREREVDEEGRAQGCSAGRAHMAVGMLMVVMARVIVVGVHVHAK